MSGASAKTPAHFVVAVFPEKHAAEIAIRALLAEHFPASAISLFVRSGVPNQGTSKDGEAVIELAGETGAGIGAAAGGLGGALAGIGLLAIPGVGPVMAVGPLAAALTGAITGGALGGFAGSLVGEGVSEAEAALAEHHMKAGRAIVLLQCANRRDQAWTILRAQGALAAASDAREKR